MGYQGKSFITRRTRDYAEGFQQEAETRAFNLVNARNLKQAMKKAAAAAINVPVMDAQETR